MNLQGKSNSIVKEAPTNLTELWDHVNQKTEEEIKGELHISLQWEPRLVDLSGLKAIGVACGFDHSMVLCGMILSLRTLIKI